MIRELNPNEDWMLTEKVAISAQIEEGFAQAERGELIDADEAIRILKSRHKKWCELNRRVP